MQLYFFLFSRDLCKHECDMCDSSFGNVVQVIGSIRLICVQKMSEYPSEGAGGVIGCKEAYTFDRSLYCCRANRDR